MKIGEVKIGEVKMVNKWNSSNGVLMGVGGMGEHGLG